MAVEDKYLHSNFQSGTSTLKKLLPSIFVGSPVKAAFATFETAAADSDGSKYRCFKGLDGSIVPLAILIATDGITGMTAVDVGLYETDLGAVCDVDCFAADLDLSSAADFGFATAIDGMDAVAIENYYKKLYEHAGHTELTQKKEYDLVLTADTVGSGAATVSVILIYAQG